MGLGLALGPALGCGLWPKIPAGEAVTPVLLSLSPSSGPAGEAYPLRVRILGRRFADSGNVVTFGGIPTGGLPSDAGGTVIEFWVPKEAPATGEAPPMVLPPGEYEVTVTTPRGTSPPAPFRLTAGAP